MEATLRDLRMIGVEIVTLGQYLRPSKRHLKVEEFVPPEKFDHWRVVGENMGFAYVASGPMVRRTDFTIKCKTNLSVYRCVPLTVPQNSSLSLLCARETQPNGQFFILSPIQ